MCDVIRWEEFLRRCRHGGFNQGISGWRQHFRPNIWKQISSDYSYDDLNSLYHYTKMLTKTTVALALKPNFMTTLLFCAVFLYACIFLNHFCNIVIFILRYQFKLLVWNTVFIPIWRVKAVQDDISAKTAPIWLHHTVPCWWHCSVWRHWSV